MKLFSALVFSSVLAVTSAAVVPATSAATVGSIMTDLTKISHLYTTTVSAIGAVPQSGVQGANTIHDHEASIETLFGDVIDNLAVSFRYNLSQILPSPVPDKTARKIIDKYQSFVPTIIDSLNALNAKASDFETLNAAPMMFDDLLSVSSPCARFAELITAMTPADMMDDVNTMFDQLTAARDNASAALASVMNA